MTWEFMIFFNSPVSDFESTPNEDDPNWLNRGWGKGPTIGYSAQGSFLYTCMHELSYKISGWISV